MCHRLGLHHHGVMEILGEKVGVDETGTYVGECNIQSLHVCQLRQGFEVCVAIALGGGVGGGCAVISVVSEV